MYIRRHRRRMYLRRFPPYFPRKTKIKLIFAFIVLLMTYCIGMSVLYMREVSTEMAVSDAIDIVTLDISRAINERMKADDIGYDRFVLLEKDTNGLVTAIKTNMSEINTLSSNLLEDIVGKGDRRSIDVNIPIGNLMGSSLLMGKGPNVPIEIIMLTSSRIDFRNDLESTGINQTKHRIVFEVLVEIDILIPWDMATARVSSEVIVAETVIVGGVPGTYISME